MDTSKISEATLGLMESVEKKFGDEDGEIIACGIVVVVEQDGMTFSRSYCTEKIHHRALGLFSEAVELVKDGRLADDD